MPLLCRLRKPIYRSTEVDFDRFHASYRPNRASAAQQDGRVECTLFRRLQQLAYVRAERTKKIDRSKRLPSSSPRLSINPCIHHHHPIHSCLTPFPHQHHDRSTGLLADRPACAPGLPLLAIAQELQPRFSERPRAPRTQPTQQHAAGAWRRRPGRRNSNSSRRAAAGASSSGEH